jgi:tetratricopeptide (TPR) repeat protein
VERRPRLIAVGASRYQHGHVHLPAAEREIVRLGRELVHQVDGELHLDPLEEEMRVRVAALRDRPDPRPLIFVWSGHATWADDDLRLLAADSSTAHTAGLPLREMVRLLADSGTTQLLVVVDTCLSGGGVPGAMTAAFNVLGNRPPDDGSRWSGVLASCEPRQNAFDGLFGRRLIRLLKCGPPAGRGRLYWAPTSEYVNGDAIGDAMLARFAEVTGQKVVFSRFGLATGLLRNPLYKPSIAGSRPVDRILAGGAAGDDPIERSPAVAALSSWIEARVPGCYALTGPERSGKSAVLAHMIGRADVYLNARGRTPDQLRDVIGSRPAGRTRVVLVDGLDQAGEHAAAIVAEVLIPASTEDCLVVATRDPGRLDPAGAVELSVAEDRPAIVEVLAAALAALTVRDGRTPELARHLLATLAWSFGTGFPEQEWIVVADALGPPGVPVERADVRWLLDHFGPYVLQDGEGGLTTYRLAHDAVERSLRGPGGAPRRRTAVAVALLDHYRGLIAAGVPAEQPHYLWEHGWRHAAEAGEATMTLLRDLASVAPALRTRLGRAEFDRGLALRSAGKRRAAAEHVENAVRLVEDGHLLAAARNNLAAMYRDTGRPGLGATVAARAAEFYRGRRGGGPAALADLAGALNNLAVCLAEAGRPDEAVEAARESSDLFRGLAVRAGTYRADLGMSLTNLSIGHRRARDAQAARRAAAEAVGIFAGAGRTGDGLGNAEVALGEALRSCGAAGDALLAVDRAVRLFRSATEPGVRPVLASALMARTECLLELARPVEAVVTVVEALMIYSSLAGTEPYFRSRSASAALLLSAALSAAGTGREPAATGPSREAGRGLITGWGGAGWSRSAEIRRLFEAASEAVLNDPEAVRRFAEDAAAQSVAILDEGGAAGAEPAEAYSQLARCRAARGDLTGAEIAAGRAVTADESSATAWVGLSQAHRRAGRSSDDVDAAREAVDRARGRTPPAPRVLAGALTNLGQALQAARRTADAVAPLAEAAGLHPAGSPAEPAALDRLAEVLSEVPGREAEAVEVARRAVEGHRDRGQPIKLADAQARLAFAWLNRGRPEMALAAAAEAAERHAGTRVVVTDQPSPSAADAEFVDGHAAPDALALMAFAEHAIGGAEAAVPAIDRAIDAYQRLLPDRLDGLAQMLALRGPAAEPLWTALLDSYPVDAPLARAEAAEPGEPRAVQWLTGVPRPDDLDRARTAALHEQARRHRAGNPAFDDAWTRATGAPPPDWLVLDPARVGAARQWAIENTPGRLAARRGTDEDLAVREALLDIPPAEAGQLDALRKEAAVVGADEAYRLRRCRRLAERFVAASPTGKRALLTDELLADPDCRRLIAARDARSGALLALGARSGTIFDLLGPDVPEGELTRELIRLAAPDDDLLGPAAEVARGVAADFLAALAGVAAGRSARGRELAGRADPEQLRILAHAGAVVAGRHPAALLLLRDLTGEDRGV